MSTDLQYHVCHYGTKVVKERPDEWTVSPGRWGGKWRRVRGGAARLFDAEGRRQVERAQIQRGRWREARLSDAVAATKW